MEDVWLISKILHVQRILCFVPNDSITQYIIILNTQTQYYRRLNLNKYLN